MNKTYSVSHAAQAAIHHRFEEQAAQSPDAIAILWGAEQWSYGELNRWANHIAHRLLRRGVMPDDRVGVCLEPSPALAASLFGVLKAGGAFVPLDPASPPERLGFVLEDGGVRLLLGSGGTLGGTSCTVLDPLVAEIGEEAVKDPDWQGVLENLAYVIYTSGSTGRPKGVLISHGNFLPLLAWSRELFGLGGQTRVLQTLSYSFDFGVFEWLTTLCSGATLVVPRDLERGDFSKYGEIVRRQRIDTVHSTPSLCRQLVTLGGSLHSLRAVHLGGEGIDWALVEQVGAAVGDGRLWNGYGPTETTVNATVFELELGPSLDLASLSSLPIGQATGLTTAVVLDAAGEKVPFGSAGELCLGGAGVARGYLGRPAWTAERFVPDPFSGALGARMYRSGDQVRRREDRELEFLGRLDQQIKLRGLRVELGEIEQVLGRVSGIAQAAVCLEDLGAQGARLVAYVVAEAFDPEGWRQALGRTLPSAMIPADFVRLQEFPLTSSGKVDRCALSNLGGERPVREAPAAPRSPGERALVEMVTEILEQSVGVHDDLLALGAHSLQLGQLVARVRRGLDRELPLTEIFRRPTVAALATFLDRAPAALRVPPIERASRGTERRLSFAQEQVWFLDQLVPENLAYNVQFTVHWQGDLRHSFLERALEEVVRRHELLRTSFGESGGRPALVVHEPFEVVVPRVDLRGLPVERRGEEAHRGMLLRSRRGFDLGRLPLVRWVLFQLYEEEHCMLQQEHHFVHDGWSIGVILGEMREAYDALVAGREVRLPALPVQYGDFVEWQRRWLVGETLEALLDFWRRRLEGSPSVLELPADRPRPAVASLRGDALLTRLDPELLDALKAYGSHRGSTLFATMLTGFFAFLGRLTGRRDLVLGSAFANRRLPELERLIGMMVNPVVLRFALDGEVGNSDAFEALVPQVRDLVFEAHGYQDLPFEKLVSALAPERDLTRNPVFQVMFSFHDSPVPEVQMEGVRGSLGQFHNRSSKMDLNITCIPRGEQLLGRGSAAEQRELAVIWEFSTDLFDRTTMERWWQHFQHLLWGAVTAPELRWTELPLLSRAEAHQLFVELQDTTVVWPGAGSLVEVLEQGVGRWPEAVAVMGEDGWLSYGELWQRALSTAEWLRGLGLGVEDRVALSMERSSGLMVGLWGILSVGAAYIPLNPGAPSERSVGILEDSKISVLLVGEGSSVVSSGPSEKSSKLASPSPLPSLKQCTFSPRDLKTQQKNPRTEGVGRWGAAYVMFTSGSTGRPKGVVVSHGAILNRLWWMQAYFGLVGGERVLQKTPLDFDVSVWELFWPAFCGATLVMAPPGSQGDPAVLQEVMVRDRVHTMHFVPSMLGAFLEFPGLEECRALRRVVASGEALPQGLVQRFYERFPGAELFNLYGPTEGAVDVSVAVCGPEIGDPVPIGRPIANTSLEVFDRGLRGVPLGVPGELHIGGLNLAQGYLGRPGQTAEKFVPAPGGERLYKTGDLVRLRFDGALEFLGRIDHQVKIRGIRIEPGEIEAVLLGETAFAEAAVVAVGNPPRLVALGVAREGASLPSLGDLQSSLRERLPDAMVPTAVVELEELPRTASGKVDRAGLMLRASSHLTRPFNASIPGVLTTPAEKLLATLWSEVLGVESPGPGDDFFELGGDSILSLRVIARAGEKGFRLRPRDFFRHRSLARLAQAAESIGLETAPEPPVVRGEVPLTPIQHWFFELDLPDPHRFHQSRWLVARRPLDVERLTRALAHLVAHHEALGLRFVREGAGWRQMAGESRRAPAVGRVDLSRLSSGQASALEAVVDSLEGSLHLEEGLLLRVALFDLGGDSPSTRVLLLVHHLVVDAVSWQVLLADLETLYRQLEEGRTPRLPTPTTPFTSWAMRLQEYAESTKVEEELGYWRGGDGKAPSIVQDGDPAANTRASADTVSTELDPETTAHLLQDVHRAYRTRIDDFFAAALARVFARDGRMPVDFEGHGREDLFPGLDLSRTVGWFTTLYPVWLETSSEASPEHTLRWVKERFRAVPRRGIGFGLLRYLGRQVHLVSQPPTEIRFNYQGQREATLAGSNLFAPAPDEIRPRSGDGLRPHVLEIEAKVVGGRLRVDWIFSQNLHQRHTIEGWAKAFRRELEGLIVHCLSPQAGSLTPSDVPLTGLDQETLVELLGTAEGIEEVLPLSPVQQGLLFHTLSGPESSVYFEQYSWVLEGLDPERWRYAWERVMGRHGVLRSTLRWRGVGQPIAVVHRHLDLPWQVLHEADLEGGLEAFLKADRRRGFDFDQSPAWRLTCIRRTDGNHHFIWSFHHLLLDGWSKQLLLEEVLHVYDEGSERGLPLPRPYGEFIAWIQARDLKAAEAFWRRHLEGFTQPTPLPCAEEVRAPERGAQRLALSADRLDRLRASAQRQGLTLNTLIRGAWALLLARHGGVREVLFGVTVAGRPAELEGAEQRVGLFLNTLPLRVRKVGYGALWPWLRELQDVQGELSAHEQTPLVTIRSWSDMPAGLPLFESLLVFESYPTKALATPSLQLGTPRVWEQTHYPLTLAVVPRGELLLILDHEPGRFESVVMRRLLHQLARLLEGMAGEVEHAEHLPMLSSAERHQLLHEWSIAVTPGAPELTVHRLFQVQAASRPHAIAVAFEGELCSYGELDRRSRSLAGRLRRRGVGEESPVVLAMERSPRLVTAMLAALAAGGSYLVLDLNTPEERLRFLLDDSRAALVLVDSTTGLRLRKWVGEERLIELKESSVDRPTALDLPRVHGDQLACVIYTSGSSGRPKGVGIPHRGIRRLVWNLDYIRFAPDDRVAQAASASFDAATFEIWGALLNGACLEMIPRPITLSPSHLSHHLQTRRTTVLFLVTALLHQVAREAPEAFHNLRVLLFGGEWADPARVREACAFPRRLIHLYGPAENTTLSTWYPVHTVPEGATSVPTGGPVPRSTVYLLGGEGTLGELAVGGEGLARGYLHRPALTAAVFVPHPHPTTPGDRLYLTGDLGRFRSDGHLEFLGRRDDQVKVRGFRIEPGEIECALSDIDGVEEVVVLSREDVPGERRLIAYVVLSDAGVDWQRGLRAALAPKLPSYMLPAAFVRLEALPRTPRGKIDRARLPEPVQVAQDRPRDPARTTQPLEAALRSIWQRVLGVEEIGLDDAFFEVGGHSLLLFRVQEQIASTLEHTVEIVDLFRHSTLRTQAAFLTSRKVPGTTSKTLPEASHKVPDTIPQPVSRKVPGTVSGRSQDIAILAMTGQFPGASSVEALWDNLCRGVESIRWFSQRELREAGVTEELLRHPDYVPAAGVVDDPELFDAAFFGYSPREAQLLDPQHRLFLECSWQALEEAGYDPRGLDVGVFAGASASSYLPRLLARRDLMEAMGRLTVMIGNQSDYLPTRVTYKLDLQGPGVAVQTACSTSLVAVHLACRSLLDGECTMALAGGASIKVPNRGYVHEPGSILSPDGHCRPFDRAAAGTVSSSGVGVVLLKRLEDALADGDPIRAVIRGSAINNDGASKVGYTAPGVAGQEAAIRRAQSVAAVTPESIGYMEAHGTGTALGDPIEFDALKRAFAGAPRGGCALGSVKSNLGHLDPAAGITGLIKAALTVEQSTLPPTLHLEQPKAELGLEESPFYIPTETMPWPVAEGPRRAAVSSFGIGGTNAHVILEEAPAREPSGPSRAWLLLPLSARTPQALEALSSQLADHLEQQPHLDLADVAHTLQVGRRAFPVRRVVFCRNKKEAIAALRGPSEADFEHTLDPRAPTPEVAFLFPGQGTSLAGIGRRLYDSEPTFREELNRCRELLLASHGFDLLEELERGEESTGRTCIAQPALLAVSTALARLLMEWGIQPGALLGHSVGEYVAAHLSGVFDLEQALHLMAERGRLMEALKGGAMMAVRLAEDEVKALLADFLELSLAAVNAPNSCVISGPAAGVEALAEYLDAQETDHRRLDVEHAFHSDLVEPASGPLRTVLEGLAFEAPRIPYLSNVSGTWIRPEQAADPDYWLDHLRQPVRFAEGIERLLEGDVPRLLVEVGPGQGLCRLVRQQAAGQGALATLPSGEESESPTLLRTLGRLWLAGVEVDWAGFSCREERRRVALPTYPFERQMHWVDLEPGPEAEPKAASPVHRGPRSETKADLADWFYLPSWKRSLAPPATPHSGGEVGEDSRWLILSPLKGPGAELVARLHHAGREVLSVPFEERDEAWERLRELPPRPLVVVHLWSLSAGPEEDSWARGFHSLLWLAQRLAEHPTDVRLVMVSKGLHSVESGDTPDPAASTLLGPLLVLPQEMPQVRCTSLDVDIEAALVDRILAEVAADLPHPQVAWRGRQRWLPTFEPVRLEATTPRVRTLRKGGVYLITGGLGRVGLRIASYLARVHRARVALLGRTPLPERSTWAQEARGEGETARKVRRLLELETQGAEVLPLVADVGDADQMASALRTVDEYFGSLHGVVHAPLGLRQLPSLLDTTVESAREQLKPKVEGLEVLAEVLRGRKLDFCCVFSSISSILGGLGYAAYSASNLFQDAFVVQQNAESPFPWLCLDWDAWAGDEPGQDPQLDRFGITPDEGGEAFERAICQGATDRLVISTRALQPRLALWVERVSVTPGEPERQEAQKPAGVPVEQANGKDPQDEVEQGVARLWCDLLGYDEVSRDDDFFDLGGDSLVGTRLMARIRQGFEVEVPLSALFDAPRLGDLAERIHDALEEASVEEEAGKEDEPEEEIPLSFVQHRLWLFDRLAGGSSVYNVPLAHRLVGQVDPGALKGALNDIIRRHSILRTHFVAVDGEPRQRIVEHLHLALPVADLRRLPKEQREGEAARLARQATRHLFDLSQSPLLLGRLFRLEDEEHAFFLNLHHTVTDGWSFGILLRELAVFYGARVSGRPHAVPELPLQFADHALAERQALGDAVLESRLTYWRKKLADLPLCELPSDRPRPPVPSYEGSQEILPLDIAFTEELRRLGRRHGATLFMTLLAAFSLLLKRLTGQGDVVVGTPVAGRSTPQTEALIGCFVNTLVLRTQVDDGLSLGDLLGRVRRTTTEALGRQDVPFDKLLEALAPERDPSRNPLFQIIFQLIDDQGEGIVFEGFETRPFRFAVGTVLLDLDVSFILGKEGVRGRFSYRRDLFDATTIRRLCTQLQTLLESLLADPSRPLEDFPILPVAQRFQLLVEWNDTDTAVPPDGLLHELFSAQVGRTPQAVAVVEEQLHLTYGALHARALRLAHRLRECGVGPESVVALRLERSTGLVESSLAVLEAGGAFLPLDPSYPEQRIETMLEDSRAAVLIASSPSPSLHGEVLELSVRTRQPSRGTEHPSSDSLAYVIYTSGSTGKPRGVEVPHRGLVNLAMAYRRYFDLRPGERTTLNAGPSFDASIWEMWNPLSWGGVLHIPGEAIRASASEMVAWVARHRIDLVSLATPLAEAFLKEHWPPGMAPRLLMTGGDRLHPHATLPTALHNCYGPSEATINTTWTRVPAGPEEPTLGRPMSNVRVHVLDGRLRPLPPGAPGELVIGGVGVSRGYLGLPARTAERFLPDPFGPTPGARLYRTGDRVRLRADGELLFLGRTDHQVKVRGQRIELGEIENLLSRHPSVREALVTWDEPRKGEKRLLAYVVWRTPSENAESRLRDDLSQQLPAAMVPALIVPLDTFPRTPNGKVDRRALPAPTPPEATGTAPRTPLEERLARVWAEVLEVDAVGVDVDFFELGGHSLLAPRLMLRLREACGVDLPLELLFRAPTVARLAAVVEARGRDDLAEPEPLDLRSEVDLWPGFELAESRPVGELQDIFLTGATGFLGAFLLHELLERTAARIYCLVRAASASEGLERLRRWLVDCKIWRPDYAARLVVLPGDLTQPRFGLEETFDALAESLDAVVHCGAWVNFTYPYEALWGSNVLGTKEAVRLAAMGRSKPLHYVSTLSVLVGSLARNRPAIFTEDDPGNTPPGPATGGYIQSKWVAEQIVQQAAAEGLPTTIYRVGRVGGHRETGVSNPRDLVWARLLGCLHLGAAATTGEPFDIAPVDYVSRAIAHLVSGQASTGQTFHLINPHPLPWLQTLDLLESLGHSLRRLPYGTWLRELLTVLEDGVDNPLAPFLPLFARLPEEPAWDSFPRFDTQRLESALSGSGITCPPVDEDLLKRCLTFLEKQD